MSYLVEGRIHHVPVVDGAKPADMLNLGGIRETRARPSANPNASEPVVRDLMPPKPTTLLGMTTMALAAQTILQVRISALLVVGYDDALTSMSSKTDVLRPFIKGSKTA